MSTGLGGLVALAVVTGVMSLVLFWRLRAPAGMTGRGDRPAGDHAVGHTPNQRPTRGPSPRRPVHAGPGGTPWTLPFLAGLVAILYGALGVQDASSIIVGSLVIVFLIFLARHMAFAASALSAAPGDMRTLTGFDFGYRPFVTVLVPAATRSS